MGRPEKRRCEVSTSEYVSVSIREGYIGAANASAHLLPEGQWWVARVFVHPRFRRGGYGSQCLIRAIELIREHSQAPVIVAPGGYDIPFEEQQAFYARCGFVGGELMTLDDGKFARILAEVRSARGEGHDCVHEGRPSLPQGGAHPLEGPRGRSSDGERSS